MWFSALESELIFSHFLLQPDLGLESINSVIPNRQVTNDILFNKICFIFCNFPDILNNKDDSCSQNQSKMLYAVPVQIWLD